MDEIEKIKETKLTSASHGLNWEAFMENDEGEEDDDVALEKFSRRLVFHRFPPKSEIQCVSQSSTIFHVVSDPSHVSNEKRKIVSCTMRPHRGLRCVERMKLLEKENILFLIRTLGLR